MFIEGWYATKIDATTATITLVGDGFGTNPGTARLIVQGGGIVAAEVLLWEDDQIVLDAPVNATIKKAEVDLPRGRGQKKIRLRSAAGESRWTGDPAPSWTVADILTTPDGLLVTGTDLANVEDAFFIDADAPVKSLNSTVVEDNGNLIVTWPANYAARLEKLVLVGDNGGASSEHDAPAAGWSPRLAGLIENLVGGVIGSQAVIQVYGIGFGNFAGQVFITEQGGTEQLAFQVGAGWTDTLIEVAADPSTTYESVRVVDSRGVEADNATTVPATITTPAVAANIVNIEQVAEDPERFHIHGSNLNGAFKFVISHSGGQLEVANPAGGATADAINTANGITTNNWTGVLVDFVTSADLSGEIVQSVQALSEVGASLGSLDIADFLVTGGGVSGSAAVTAATDGVYTAVAGSRDEGGFIRINGTGLASMGSNGKVIVKDSGLNDIELGKFPGGQASPSTWVAGPTVPTEKYTDLRVIDNAGQQVPVSVPVDEFFLGISLAPNASEIVTLDSPAQDQIRIVAPDLASIGYAIIQFTEANLSFVAQLPVYFPAMNRHDSGGQATADSSNALFGFSVAVTDGTPDDEWLITVAAGTSFDVRGKYVARVTLYPNAGIGPGELVFDALTGGDTAFQVTP